MPDKIIPAFKVFWTLHIRLPVCSDYFVTPKFYILCKICVKNFYELFHFVWHNWRIYKPWNVVFLKRKHFTLILSMMYFNLESWYFDTHVVFGGEFLAGKQSIQTENPVSVGLMTAVDAGHSSGAEDLLRASWIIRSCSKHLSFWCC